MKLARPRRTRSRSLDDALLPLVNVVFLLMVFFLSAGHFGAPKPVSATPQSTRSEASVAAPRVLELRSDGRLMVQGELFTDAELPGRSLGWQGAPLDVRAAGDIPAERVLRVLAILRGAGVRDVRLLTVKGGG
ncbi:MAG: biopolymer transporter ExbD [Stagnimonas sp.]|nr:biopolymer transporter ExbD [Stagnimonas sp.]